MSTIQRIIDQDIYTNASTMVADLLAAELVDVMPALCDLLLECSLSDDWEEPVRYEITQCAYVSDLVDVAEMLNTELTTKTGAVIDYDTASDYNLSAVDTSALLDLIEEGNQWQEVAELLDVEPEAIEAMQHWAVSDYLADLLEQVGGLIARDVLGFNVWGRTECGQGLGQDSTLARCADLVDKRLAAALSQK